MSILEFIQKLMQEPSLFLGLIALLGFLFLRERIERTISGTLKTAIGLLILLAGVNLMVQSLIPLGDLAGKALGLPPLKIEIGTNKIITELGTQIGLVMLFAFLINVLLARITPLKYIYLTGHLIFWNAVIFVTAFKYMLKLDGASLVIVSSIFVGLYQTLQPWYTHKFDLFVNENSGFVLGHSSSLPVLVTSLLTRTFSSNGKKKAKSMEELTFPKALEWLREPMLLMAATFIIIYVIMAIANYSYVVDVATKAGKHPILWIILQALNFAAGFSILMVGVRMIIAELIPAFKGIAEKIVPGATPALDCPLFFPYGQVSMAYGGLIGMFAMVLTSLIFAGFKYQYFIFAPTMSAWFHGATAGVYGNKYWGIPGAILGGIVAGVLMGVGQALMWPIIGFAIGDFFSWASDSDYVLLPLLIALVAKILGRL
ncbi:MAG: PTS transporter subunit IIC [Dictyoglomaceae bacterium]